MKCLRAIIYYVDGKPASYSLILEGSPAPAAPKDAKFRETSFKEAFDTFPAIRKHWNEDGTAKD